MSLYYATKAYILHFTEAIADEVKDKNICISALCPGQTNTNFQILNLNQYIQDLKTTLKLNTMGYLKFLPIDFKVCQNDRLNGNNGFFSAIIERKF